MAQWRAVIGHEGYLVARLRMLTSDEGGRGRAVQSGYRARWWLVGLADEAWLGEGPLDLVGDRRSLQPGDEAEVRVHPMDPSQWQGLGPGVVLHLREWEGRTLGVATVQDVVGVPAEAPLQVVDLGPRRGQARLILRRDPRTSGVLRFLRRLARG